MIPLDLFRRPELLYTSVDKYGKIDNKGVVKAKKTKRPNEFRNREK